MSERCRTREAVEITGLGLRQLQSMAARGEIPGAAKMGRSWTFGVRKLRAWVSTREAATCQAISTGAATSGGRGSRFAGATSDEAYERLLS